MLNVMEAQRHRELALTGVSIVRSHLLQAPGQILYSIQNPGIHPGKGSNALKSKQAIIAGADPLKRNRHGYQWK